MTATFDSDFLEILRCPEPTCRGQLELKDDNRFVCIVCRRCYPIHDGIPVFLVEEATVEEE
jgi:uncharacterized protein YbaR (Trm112 family)